MTWKLSPVCLVIKVRIDRSILSLFPCLPSGEGFSKQDYMQITQNFEFTCRIFCVKTFLWPAFFGTETEISRKKMHFLCYEHKNSIFRIQKLCERQICSCHWICHPKIHQRKKCMFWKAFRKPERVNNCPQNSNQSLTDRM